MNATVILAVLASLVLLGMLLEEVFRRTGIPDVLVLLVLGLVASIAGVLDVASLKGIDQVFTTAALVLILFEGATRLRLDELKVAMAPALVLTGVSFVLTVAVVGALAMTLFGMRPAAGLCLGAIVGGTSSAVVIPMVAQLPLAQRTRTVLILESALSDVLCIVATLVLVGLLAPSSRAIAPQDVGLDLVKGLGGALVFGALSGWAWAHWLHGVRQRRASILVVGAAVFLVFAVAEMLGLYGAIAVLSFGVILGNANVFASRSAAAGSTPAPGASASSATTQLGLSDGEKTFLAESAFFLKVLFFVYLGAALKLDGYEPFVFGGLVTVVVFALRPLAVRVSLRPQLTTRADASIAAALVPKGLAAAVLASVPTQMNVTEGPLIEAIVFGCVLFTITIAALLVLFRKRAFVAAAFDRLFAAYPAADAALPVAENAVEEASAPDNAVLPHHDEALVAPRPPEVIG